MTVDRTVPRPASLAFGLIAAAFQRRAAARLSPTVAGMSRHRSGYRDPFDAAGRRVAVSPGFARTSLVARGGLFDPIFLGLTAHAAVLDAAISRRTGRR
jgi:hypothetical protein